MKDPAGFFADENDRNMMYFCRCPVYSITQHKVYLYFISARQLQQSAPTTHVTPFVHFVIAKPVPLFIATDTIVFGQRVATVFGNTADVSVVDLLQVR